MAEKKYMTALAKVNDTYLPMIADQIEGKGIRFSEYARQCVLHALAAINATLDKAGIAWNNPQLDQSNLTTVLLQVASLQLNASAQPREVYFQIRNIKQGNEWKKQIEMGIEGDGNDAILARFGRGVKEIKPFWVVREGDKFEYPKFKGLEMEPPVWEPTGQGEVVRVVYPIIMADNTVHFYIAERADVARNLAAHISNNLMNETFGICADRYKATAEQKKKIDAKKAEIMAKVKAKGLDALDDPDLQEYISPAWTEPQSREAMILRKMRNNVVKKIPKDFGSAFIGEAYETATDDAYIEAQAEVTQNQGAGPVIAIDPATGEVIEDEAAGADAESDADAEAEAEMQAQMEPPVAEQTTLEGPGF